MGWSDSCCCAIIDHGGGERRCAFGGKVTIQKANSKAKSRQAGRQVGVVFDDDNSQCSSGVRIKGGMQLGGSDDDCDGREIKAADSKHDLTRQKGEQISISGEKGWFGWGWGAVMIAELGYGWLWRDYWYLLELLPEGLEE